RWRRPAHRHGRARLHALSAAARSAHAARAVAGRLDRSGPGDRAARARPARQAAAECRGVGRRARDLHLPPHPAAGTAARAGGLGAWRMGARGGALGELSWAGAPPAAFGLPPAISTRPIPRRPPAPLASRPLSLSSHTEFDFAAGLALEPPRRAGRWA